MIRDAVDVVDVYIDCMRTSSSQCVQSLVSTSRLILTLGVLGGGSEGLDGGSEGLGGGGGILENKGPIYILVFV